MTGEIVSSVFFVLGATLHTRQEIQCIPFVGFFCWLNHRMVINSEGEERFRCLDS